MTPSRARHAALRLALAVLVAAGVSAAARAEPPATLEAEAEASLRQRVSTWWDARARRDHQTMYGLFEPGFRESTPYERYLEESVIRTRFEIVAHEIASLEVVGEDRVRVTITYQFLFPRFGKPTEGSAREEWAAADGEWFKVHEPIRPPFPPPSQR